jgi:hypothetical protein
MAANPLSRVSIRPGLEISPKSYSELCKEIPVTVQRIVVVNSTDAPIMIGVGPEKKEEDHAAFGPGSTIVLGVGMNAMPKGSRLAVKSLGPCTGGYFSVSYL